MALEVGPVYVDEKDIASAGTPEALTTREIHCSSLFILPKPGNSGDVLLVDTLTTSKTLIIPTSGITLPIGDPRLVKLDVTNSSDGVTWTAV